MDIVEEYIEKIILHSKLSREEVLELLRQKKEENKGLSDIGALFAIKKDLGLDFSVKERYVYDEKNYKTQADRPKEQNLQRKNVQEIKKQPRWKSDREMHKELKKSHKELEKRLAEDRKQWILEKGEVIRELGITGETTNNIIYECECFLKKYDGIPRLRIPCFFLKAAPLYDRNNPKQYEHDKFKLMDLLMVHPYVYDPDEDKLYQEQYPIISKIEFVSDLNLQEFNLESKKDKKLIHEKVHKEVLEAVEFFAKNNPAVFSELSDRVMIKKTDQPIDPKELEKRIKKKTKKLF